MGVIVLVPAGAFAFAVFALPSIAKRLLPILAYRRCAARLLVGTGGPGSRHRVLAKPGKASKDAEQYDTPIVGHMWRDPLDA
jgi:hypothetical protein